MSDKQHKNIFSNALKDGVFLLLPLGVTIGLIYWVWSILRGFVPDITPLLPREWVTNPYFFYFFDLLFFLVIIVIIILSGMIASTFLGRFFNFLIDKILLAPTFIRPIYTSFKKIAESIFQQEGADPLAQGLSESILIPYPNETTYSIGFVTSTHAKHLLGDEEGDKWLTVYVPSAPVVSAGFYIVCKKEDTQVCKLPSGEAMTTIISVGATQNKKINLDNIDIHDLQKETEKPNRLGLWFTNGLLFLTPLTATIAMLSWVFNYLYQFLMGITHLLPQILPSLIPAQHYDLIISASLMVIIAFVVMIIGFLGESAMGHWIKSLSHRFLNMIPMFKEVYGIVEQIVQVFSPDPSKNSTFDQAVLVPYPTKVTYAVGFVTGANGSTIKETDGHNFTPVFIPTTPIPTTGWFILAPKDQLIPLTLPVEKAFGLVISGGILADDK